MSSRDIYNQGYSFAKERNERKVRILLLVSLLIPVIIVGSFIVNFVLGLDFFAKKQTQTKPVFTDTTQEQKTAEQQRVAQAQALQQSYARANLPYMDPQNRFQVGFVTPFVSDQIIVVFYTDKDYANLKKEADAIIQNAKRTVEINSVSYVNTFNQE